MPLIIQSELRYSDEITIQLTGTEEAALEFVGQSTRGAAALPITVSAQTGGEWQAEEPGKAYWEDVQALQDSLAQSRGSRGSDSEESQGYLLHPGLTPYLDELPEWLQENLVYPVPGVLESGALLPLDAAERWRTAVEHLSTLEEIKGQFFASSETPPLLLEAAPSTRGATTATRRVDGFLVVGIVTATLDCKQYRLDDSGLAVNFLHYYTFPKPTRDTTVSIKVRTVVARLAIDNVGNGTVHGPETIHAVTTWSKQVRPQNITKEVGIYIRNMSEVADCKYDLLSECQAIGVAVGHMPG